MTGSRAGGSRDGLEGSHTGLTGPLMQRPTRLCPGVPDGQMVMEEVKMD